jgi:hypothetical protein
MADNQQGEKGPDWCGWGCAFVTAAFILALVVLLVMVIVNTAENFTIHF